MLLPQMVWISLEGGVFSSALFFFDVYLMTKQKVLKINFDSFFGNPWAESCQKEERNMNGRLWTSQFLNPSAHE